MADLGEAEAAAKLYGATKPGAKPPGPPPASSGEELPANDAAITLAAAGILPWLRRFPHWALTARHLPAAPPDPYEVRSLAGSTTASGSTRTADLQCSAVNSFLTLITTKTHSGHSPHHCHHQRPGPRRRGRAAAARGHVQPHRHVGGVQDKLPGRQRQVQGQGVTGLQLLLAENLCVFG